MSTGKRKPDHISQEDWDAVDSPPLTREFMSKMRPAREFFSPEQFKRLTKGRGPQKAATKKLVSLRLDQDVLEHFQTSGEGWQTRINEALRKVMEQA